LLDCARAQGRGRDENHRAQLVNAISPSSRTGATGSTTISRAISIPWAGPLFHFVFCDGQHRTAFDFSYLDEVLRKAGFRDVVESAEGQSRLYGETVPAANPATPRGTTALGLRGGV
jgi:hypothetical protein